MDFEILKWKIERWIDRILPTRIRIKPSKYTKYGYRYTRHAESSYEAMSMLSYAVAREMQYCCRNTSEMKEMIRDFEKGTLWLACDLYNDRKDTGISHE